MSGAQKYHAIYPVFDFAASYMYASRKIEESGNWDETFLTRHMRLSVYQTCNKSLHWAMPSLWSWCSCSPLTSCFWCSCIHSVWLGVSHIYMRSFLHFSSICILCWTVLVFTTPHQWASMCFSTMPIPSLRCLIIFHSWDVYMLSPYWLKNCLEL